MRKANEASREIANRIKELREMLDITADDMSVSVRAYTETVTRAINLKALPQTLRARKWNR